MGSPDRITPQGAPEWVDRPPQPVVVDMAPTPWCGPGLVPRDPWLDAIGRGAMNDHQRRSRRRVAHRHAIEVCARTGITPRDIQPDWSSVERVSVRLPDGSIRHLDGVRQLQDLARAYAPHPSDYVRVGPDPVSGMADKP